MARDVLQHIRSNLGPKLGAFIGTANWLGDWWD
jgi:hypothetical protein